MTMFDVAERIEEVMWNSKKMFANLDWYSAISYHVMGWPTAWKPMCNICAFTLRQSRAAH